MSAEPPVYRYAKSNPIKACKKRCASKILDSLRARWTPSKCLSSRAWNPKRLAADRKEKSELKAHAETWRKDAGEPNRTHAAVQNGEESHIMVGSKSNVGPSPRTRRVRPSCCPCLRRSPNRRRPCLRRPRRPRRRSLPCPNRRHQSLNRRRYPPIPCRCRHSSLS